MGMKETKDTPIVRSSPSEVATEVVTEVVTEIEPVLLTQSPAKSKKAPTLTHGGTPTKLPPMQGRTSAAGATVDMMRPPLLAIDTTTGESSDKASSNGTDERRRSIIKGPSI